MTFKPDFLVFTKICHQGEPNRRKLHFALWQLKYTCGCGTIQLDIFKHTCAKYITWFMLNIFSKFSKKFRKRIKFNIFATFLKFRELIGAQNYLKAWWKHVVYEDKLVFKCSKQTPMCHTVYFSCHKSFNSTLSSPILWPLVIISSSGFLHQGNYSFESIQNVKFWWVTGLFIICSALWVSKIQQNIVPLYRKSNIDLL